MGEEGMADPRASVPKRARSCDQLRYIARRLHERAVKYEHLADYISNAPGEIDDAMFEILCKNSVE